MVIADLQSEKLRQNSNYRHQTADRMARDIGVEVMPELSGRLVRNDYIRRDPSVFCGIFKKIYLFVRLRTPPAFCEIPQTCKLSICAAFNVRFGLATITFRMHKGPRSSGLLHNR
jgi:hypothetical protein